MLNHHYECSKILIENKANVNAENLEGETCLHLAASEEECEDICKLLIDNGADLNAKTTSHLSPLVYAVMGDNMEGLRLIANNPGTDLLLKDNKGENVSFSTF